MPAESTYLIDSKRIRPERNITRFLFNVLVFVMAIVLLFAMAIAGIFIYIKYFYIFSDGYLTGQLKKFSHSGNIIKTYEGEMILSSVTGNQNIANASEKFCFSVTCKKLANQLETVQGQMVIVHYEQKHASFFRHGNSGYIVNSVKQKP